MQSLRSGIDVTGFARSSVEKPSVMIRFEVADLRIAVDEPAQRGVRFIPSQAETILDDGPALVATFVDPDGNFTQIPQRKPP